MNNYILWWKVANNNFMFVKYLNNKNIKLKDDECITLSTEYPNIRKKEQTA